MEDMRELVPRTPPEGLREWVLQRRPCGLAMYGLVYEAEWVKAWDPFQMLDEMYDPKKKKMVRVKCSCCGEETLLNWAKDSQCGYGFVHPDDEEGDWERTVTSSGDTTRCPMCNEHVLVRKRSEVKDYYITGETTVCSASLVGEENFLALTMWVVQNRTSKNGGYWMEIIPAEAYVFSSTECVNLMGWKNAYSGNAGYFIQYTHQWRQPKDWNERLGCVDEILGLDPELIAASSLPHCKLDEYMKPRPGARRYPVLYLCLYQEHPNVESILLHGLPLVLDDLIAAGMAGHDNLPCGRLSIQDIDWTASRPAQMLHLTKDELRMARNMCWGRYLWELFVKVKETGEVLTAQDIETAFCLGDDNVLQLVGRGPVAKSLRYLMRQCEQTAVEGEDEDPPPYGIPDVQMLIDYWRMARTLGRNLDDLSVRFPLDLIVAHDDMTALIQRKLDSDSASLFRIRRKQLSRYTFRANGLLIRPAASQEELTREGDLLHHCVRTYGKKYAAGETAIFFIRRSSNPREPYYTLEFDEQKLTVRQNRCCRNGPRTPEIQTFEDLWLSWIRAGAPRDGQGKPILPLQVRIGVA